MGNSPSDIPENPPARCGLELPRNHGLRLVLVEPEIPQNAGNIARLCAVTGVELHLVRPLGFILSDRHLKRAGMDYLHRIKLVIHDDLAALQNLLDPPPAVAGALADASRAGDAGGSARYWLASSKARNCLWDIDFRPGDWFVLGKETAGLPASWTARAARNTLAIPMASGERCLNLSTSAGILVYEALRQIALKTNYS